MNRIVKLKPKKEKAVLNKHPWVFSGAVAKANAKDGDIVEVVDADNRFLAYGFYSSESQIVCRLFEWDKSNDKFDETYWAGKIDRALQLRKSIIDFSSTNAYRLLHAEGDFLPGLIADVYKDTLVLQISITGIEQRKELFFDIFKKAGYSSIYLRSSGSSKKNLDVKSEGVWIAGEDKGPFEVLENGLKFMIDVVEGQKTGFFLDQRDNRELLKRFSSNKKVLNAFSYTGGFSVYAQAGGAEEVHSLDISADAVKGAEDNVLLNFPTASHKSIVKDCFEFLKEMPENYYDLIILDPPAFAKSAAAVDRAARGYKDINMRAFRKIKKGGMLFTYSCSQHITKDLFQKIIFGAAADSGRNVRILFQLHQPADHPVNLYHPEGEYLKGLALWLE
ncbi:MAG: class I SAM-dependent rRNA methyltransferase [Sporocytophaga sp.]|uniref:class I SAM-dependent rRNA methyltransferase n=1 Tax=Sporocytophaga sp. TaxID=2231183 RepID=UPI001B2F011A|nr:class I SAM-dependent rRNA methyltransferase [Sporocytophaga sp.]MBO9701995.1 class I SAM-dependent rRNA methyltransferase [Sporocytophaga sp.]